MDPNDESPSPLRFPPRMFALGEEPVGVTVTPYHKPTCIRKILNAFEPDEVQSIRETQFGKLVEIADKPSFSGRFGLFLLSQTNQNSFKSFLLSERVISKFPYMLVFIF